MNILHLLQNQHDEFRKLIGQIQSAEEPQERLIIFKRLKERLEYHQFFEEKYFYPLFKYMGEAAAWDKESYSDHQLFLQKLNELLDVPIADDFWLARFNFLAEELIGHAAIEEKAIFPKADALGRENLENAGRTALAIEKGKIF